jgi:hypothetical protein
MFNPQSTIYGGDGLIKATNFPDFIFNILCSLPILFVFLLKEKRKETLVFILMALMLSYSIFFDVKLVISDQNTKEAGLYIREHTEKNDLIIAPKAVSYYAGDLKVYTNDNNKPKLNFSAEYLNEYFTKSFQNRKMNDSFFWPEGIYSGIYDPAPTKEELERAVYVVKYYKVEGYEPEKIIGEFWIYRLK